MSDNSLKHILLVEDEAVYAMNLKRQLTDEGYYITHTPNGTDTLAILEHNTNTPDLIIMDIVLEEETDSIDTAGKILENYNIPLIFHSSYTEKEIVERTESVAHYGFVVKSADLSVLKTSIKNTFRLFEEKKAAKKIIAEYERINDHADGNTASDREDIQNLLMQKDSMLNAIIESSPDVIIFALDRNYRYISFNSNHKKTMKQIWGKDIAVGDNMLDVIGLDSDREHAKKNFDRALAGEYFNLKETYGDEDLSRLYWVDYYSPLISPKKIIMGLSCFVLNNTKQRQAEEKIKSLLREKSIILKEVHHRIKNNMNNVFMLLHLQAEAQTNKEAGEILKSAAVRIQSMMVLYEKLYQSQSDLDISLKTYTYSLVEEIKNIMPREKQIDIILDIDEMKLNVSTISCMGILINELLTNSIKHAFIGQQTGEIHISIKRKKDVISMEYSDNGSGLSEETLNNSKSGFGITLIKLLTKQLNGGIELPESPGTGIRISFEYMPVIL